MLIAGLLLFFSPGVIVDSRFKCTCRAYAR